MEAELIYPELDEDLGVLDQWRALHGPPMQATNMFLRSIARSCGIDAQVKQRHKRHPQILQKLARQSIRLSQVEDIGGCRVIATSLAHVRTIEECVRDRTSKTIIDHVDDYVTGPPGPRAGGYRAVHLQTVRDGMKIEVQLRTELQHEWAELVETWDETFNTDVKHEQAPDPALEYFRLQSAHFAYHDRGEPVPSELIRELSEAASRLQEWGRRQ